MNSLNSFQFRRLPAILFGVVAALTLVGILFFIVTQTAAAQSVETGNAASTFTNPDQIAPPMMLD